MFVPLATHPVRFRAELLCCAEMRCDVLWHARSPALTLRYDPAVRSRMAGEPEVKLRGPSNGPGSKPKAKVAKSQPRACVGQQ